MKKMFRHTACILAALALSSVGTACGDTAATPTETADVTVTTTVTAATEAIPSEYSAPEVDYGGEVFTMAAYGTDQRCMGHLPCHAYYQ